MSDKSRPFTPEEKQANSEGMRFIFDFWNGLTEWEAEVLQAMPPDTGLMSGHESRIYSIYADGRPPADAVDYIRRDVIGTYDVVASLSAEDFADLAELGKDLYAPCHMRIRDVHMEGGSVEDVIAQIRQEIGAATAPPAQ